MDENKITYFGETDSRNQKRPFGIKSKDRSRHVYIIGKTGMGKSTLLENMAVQDIQNGEGMAFIDPHGKTAELLLEYVPENRIKDVIYFAPFDTEFPISFNVMEDVGPNKRHLVANGLMSAFKKIWVDAWSARMEYILNNILLALLEYPDSTLVGVNRMLADKDYRKLVVDNITDPSVKSFWVDEFAKYGDRYMQEAGAAIQNKIGQFIANPLVRNIIGQPKSTFDIRDVMDKKKILIINLSKGRVGETNANLLGSMLITKIYLGAMSRADASESNLRKLPQFYLYVDEFQSFANESFADILSEARKYKLNLTIAHQYIEQMSDEVRAAVFGNVGTMITFRVGAYDAEVLEKEFAPIFTAEDLVNLGFIQIYLKLMIDGVSSSPFSATTLPPIAKPESSLKDKIVETSRNSFAQPKHLVEEEIRKWHQPIRASENAPRREEKRPAPAVSHAPHSEPAHMAEPVQKKNPFAEIAQKFKENDISRTENMKQEEVKKNIIHTENKSQNESRSVTHSSSAKETVSLSDLKRTPVRKDTKGPSEKNLGELRRLLESVAKSEPRQSHTANNHTNKPQENKNSNSEKKPEQKSPESHSSPKEVPEKELRKILEG